METFRGGEGRGEAGRGEAGRGEAGRGGVRRGEVGTGTGGRWGRSWIGRFHPCSDCVMELPDAGTARIDRRGRRARSWRGSGVREPVAAAASRGEGSPSGAERIATWIGAWLLRRARGSVGWATSRKRCDLGSRLDRWGHERLGGRPRRLVGGSVCPMPSACSMPGVLFASCAVPPPVLGRRLCRAAGSARGRSRSRNA